jgi:predicted alpha/beta-fold hydrolase
MAVGLSMGGNILLRYAGQAKAYNSPLKAVVAICQSYDLLATSLHILQKPILNRGLNEKMKQVIKRQTLGILSSY